MPHLDIFCASTHPLVGAETITFSVFHWSVCTYIHACITLYGTYAHVSYLVRLTVSTVSLLYCVGVCLHCFDAVGWAAGRASGL